MLTIGVKYYCTVHVVNEVTENNPINCTLLIGIYHEGHFFGSYLV